MMRIVLVLLGLALAGCGTLRYAYEPSAAHADETKYGVRLGVFPFVRGDYALDGHPGRPTLENLEVSLGRSLAAAMRGTERFRAVVFLDEPVPDSPEAYRTLGERYGLDGFFVGRLTRLAYASYPPVWAFLPPFYPTVPLGVIGVPLMPRWYHGEAMAELRLISARTGATAWKSPALRRRESALRRVSWYSRSQRGVELHKRLLDGLFDDALQEVRLLVGGAEMRALEGGDRPTSQTLARRYALVIGISDYRFAGSGGLNNLRFADDDARAFRDALLATGWGTDEVRMLLNEEATRRHLQRAVEAWLGRAGPEDLVVLYWAGHGYEAEKPADRVYFACHDTDVGVPDQGWRMDDLIEALERIPARNVVLAVDVCHAERLAERVVRHPARRGTMPGKDITAPPAGWVLLMTARGQRQAAEHPVWGGGLFTRCLVDGLEGRADTDVDGRVTLGELRCYMETVMPVESRGVLGEASRPVILSDTSSAGIWDLSLSPDGWEESIDAPDDAKE